jgi:EAL and modified HD-GYP domain-containing signal transduction protein
MELLAKEMGLDRASQDLAFMAGMFSMLGILFGTSLPELIRPLQLSEELVAAIIDHQGHIGHLLQLQKCADRCDAGAAAALLAGLHLTPAQATLASVAACQWMLGITREAQGATHD